MASILTERLEMFRGDDFVFRFAFTEVDETTPVDISGWSFKLTLKLHYEMEEDEASIMVNKGANQVIHAQDGVLFMTLPSAETANLISTTYYFDLQRESGESYTTVTTVFRGKIKVHGDVTRRVG